MGSLVSLLVLGAIYSVVYVVKNLGGKEDARPFGESFPTIDVLEPETGTETWTEAPATQVVSPTRNVETQRVRKKEAGNAPQTIAVETPENNVSEPVREGRLVKIGNKSEAKRAFIYSEIFNRKY